MLLLYICCSDVVHADGLEENFFFLISSVVFCKAGPSSLYPCGTGPVKCPGWPRESSRNMLVEPGFLLAVTH